MGTFSKNFPQCYRRMKKEALGGNSRCAGGNRKNIRRRGVIARLHGLFVRQIGGHLEGVQI